MANTTKNGVVWDVTRLLWVPVVSVPEQAGMISLGNQNSILQYRPYEIDREYSSGAETGLFTIFIRRTGGVCLDMKDYLFSAVAGPEIPDVQDEFHHGATACTKSLVGVGDYLNTSNK